MVYCLDFQLDTSSKSFVIFFKIAYMISVKMKSYEQIVIIYVSWAIFYNIKDVDECENIENNTYYILANTTCTNSYIWI